MLLCYYPPQYQNKNYSTDASSLEYEEVEDFEISVKPKRKLFANEQERKKYVDDFTKKIKTEYCKTFLLKGQCKFGEKCSFAHYEHELKPKTHLHQKYKTKQCKRYFNDGVCHYGLRCQYSHKTIVRIGIVMASVFQQINYIIEQIKQNLNRPDISRFIQVTSQEFKVLSEEFFVFTNSRLPLFNTLN